MGSRLVARAEALARSHVEPIWRLLQADRALRWAALALVPVAWVTLAWQDVRFLAAVPVLCFAVAAAHRFQPIELPPAAEDDDWF